MQVMDVPTLIARALRAADGNQAELARRLGVSESTVSRWIAGKSGLDYESCLRLARITGLSAWEVAEIAGLDPQLLPPGSGVPQRPPTPLEDDVRRRTARIQAMLEATEGLPEPYVETYIRTILDHAETQIVDWLKMLRNLREMQSQQRAEDRAPSPSADEVPHATPPGRKRRSHRPIKPREWVAA